MITIFKCNICGIEHRTMQVPKVHKDEEAIQKNLNTLKSHREELEEYRKEKIEGDKEAEEDYSQYVEKKRIKSLKQEADVIYYNDKWYHFGKRKIEETNNYFTVISASGEEKAFVKKPDSKTSLRRYQEPFPREPTSPIFCRTKYLCCPTCGQKTYIL